MKYIKKYEGMPMTDPPSWLMPTLKPATKMRKKIKTPHEYDWLQNWIEDKYKKCDFLVEEISNKIKITIYCDFDSFEGFDKEELDKIYNFSNYLKDSNLIKKDSNFNFTAQFTIKITMDKETFDNNDDLNFYRDAKQYNL
jgi:hypothetical protein